jgi:D-alanyl-lipoteichoic acid acyltransferase DltB (MBOAT superfamily)
MDLGGWYQIWWEILHGNSMHPVKKYHTARQATLPRGSFWHDKLTTSDNLSNVLSHLMTFYGQVVTFVMTRESCG